MRAEPKQRRKTECVPWMESGERGRKNKKTWAGEKKTDGAEGGAARARVPLSAASPDPFRSRGSRRGCAEEVCTGSPSAERVRIAGWSSTSRWCRAESKQKEARGTAETARE